MNNHDLQIAFDISHVLSCLVLVGQKKFVGVFVLPNMNYDQSSNFRQF